MFFLVEKPFKRHLDIIEFAATNQKQFDQEIKKLEAKLREQGK